VEQQPEEVLQNARNIFQRAYAQHGPLSGNKAKALVLVSLLYSNRLLHGANAPGGQRRWLPATKNNEEYLLRHLSIPTRIMNKAFTQMASAADVRRAPFRAPASVALPLKETQV
jgi:hypothetical protein